MMQVTTASARVAARTMSASAVPLSRALNPNAPADAASAPAPVDADAGVRVTTLDSGVRVATVGAAAGLARVGVVLDAGLRNEKAADWGQTALFARTALLVSRAGAGKSGAGEGGGARPGVERPGLRPRAGDNCGAESGADGERGGLRGRKRAKNNLRGLFSPARHPEGRGVDTRGVRLGTIPAGWARIGRWGAVPGRVVASAFCA